MAFRVEVLVDMEGQFRTPLPDKALKVSRDQSREAVRSSGAWSRYIEVAQPAWSWALSQKQPLANLALDQAVACMRTRLPRPAAEGPGRWQTPQAHPDPIRGLRCLQISQRALVGCSDVQAMQDVER